MNDDERGQDAVLADVDGTDARTLLQMGQKSQPLVSECSSHGFPSMVMKVHEALLSGLRPRHIAGEYGLQRWCRSDHTFEQLQAVRRRS